MTAALPMGTNKITGMADPTVSTDGATKNYVDTSVAAFFSTGDGKLTLKTVADTGWILCDDGTFGSASSGASNRANADTQNLFTLFFNNISDTAAPLLTSGGGATTRAAQVSAAAAWAANCRMTLTLQLGRAIAIAGSGSGLTARALGSAIGEEKHTLALSELPTGIASAAANTITVFANGNNQVVVPTSLNGGISSFSGSIGGTAVSNFPGSNLGNWSGVSSFNASNNISVTSTNTLGGAHNNIQPTTFWNIQIKL